ncbi:MULTISPECIES: DUF5839 family protein [Bacillales]|uniref:Uncharacterized protein n=4 Tax=Bacillales TaxID=1385 RepID=G3GCB0_9BACL|nr:MULTISPECIES: DUF5839 family protein [Bacillales]AEM62950.1 hypothetical protein [Bhargavaea cecembensis]HJF32917.1 DUF5839 family protein [Sporosarcina psychrophila]HJG32346.1 DUF5839 family protein [Jeotgalicoccus aerolatus]AEM62955.1 hypothetical protein [Bhargavaea cecembensis]AKE50923.1 hypothetical protein [Staphylococcus aureus]
MNNNTISGFHILGTENGNLKLNTNKMYHWHIQKKLRNTLIAQGDIVLVQTKRGNRPILVMNVFREEDKEKKRKYKRVIKLLEKAPEKSHAVKS